MSVGDVSVLGGGWSVKGEGVDVSNLPGIVIGVNDAFRYAKVDIILSMDRLWAENRWELLKLRETPVWLRRSAVQNIKERPDWLNIYECDNADEAALSDKQDRLNGANSGFCAVNLAYLLRPKRLFLFGFDMRRGPAGEPYWYKPYEWRPEGGTTQGKYRSWINQFSIAEDRFLAIGTEVYLIGERSLIQAFRKISSLEFREMLK